MSAPDGEVCLAADRARQAYTLVLVEGLRIFQIPESRNPFAESRSALGRRTPRATHPSTRANDFRWHHRRAHLNHVPFGQALARQSEFLPSDEAEEPAEDRPVNQPRRSDKPGPLCFARRLAFWRRFYFRFPFTGFVCFFAFFDVLRMLGK